MLSGKDCQIDGLGKTSVGIDVFVDADGMDAFSGVAENIKSMAVYERYMNFTLAVFRCGFLNVYSLLALLLHVPNFSDLSPNLSCRLHHCRHPPTVICVNAYLYS